VLAVIVVAAIIGVLVFMGSIIQKTVVTVGPPILGTTVELNDVSVSLLSGGFKLNGLRIGNPEGFTQEQPLVAVGKLNVAVAPLSLVSDTIVLKKLIVKDAEFSFETKGGVLGIGGKNNLSALMDNLSKYTSSDPKDEKAPEVADDSPPKKFIMNHVLVEGAKVNMIIGGNAVQIPLPTIEFKDIGVKEGGVQAGTAVAQIMGQVLGETVKHVLVALKDETLKVGGQAADGAGKAVQGGLDAVKGLFK